ncbi:MAG: T9SS type A sorting domain-containing protein, partial [Bacteroidota bacterium]
IDMGAIESDIISMVTDELAAGQNVKVYPNPFSGQVWLELTDKSTTLDTWTLFIWNEQGRLVTQRKVLNRLVLLDTMAWASGTYVLAGKRRDGTSLFSRRVVKH